MFGTPAQYGESHRTPAQLFAGFAKPAIAAAIAAALICNFHSAQAQLSIPGGNAPAAPPASPQFRAGFEAAGAVVQRNTGLGNGEPLNLKANAGKSDAEAAAADLRVMQQFLASRWDGADDKSRGYFARVTEDLTQMIQMKIHALAPGIPTHLSDAGYFATMPDGSDANPTKAHALMLLGDTAAELDAMNNGIAADKNKSALGKAVDSKAAGMVPGVNIAHYKRKASAESNGGSTVADNSMLGMIRATTENVMTAVGIKDDSATEAEAAQGAAPAAAAAATDHTVLVSCVAAKTGQDLNLVEVRINSQKIDATDGDDTSIDWTLPDGAVGHAMLACGYSRKGDQTLKIPASGWITQPIPAGAKTCTFTHDPGKASCSS